MPSGALEGAAPLWREADWTLARIAEAVSIVGPDGHHLHVNPAATAIFAQLSARAEGRTVDEVPWGAVDAEGAPVPNDQLPSEITRLTGVECTDVELGFPDARGELLWLRISTRRQSDGEAPFGVVVSFVDVTERHEIEAALARSEEGFRLLAEHSGDVVARMDMDNRYLYVSPAAERIYGWRPEDMLGRSEFEFIHADDELHRHVLHRELLEGRDVATSEFRMLRPDGGWLWVEGTMVVVRGADGTPEGLQSTTRGISRRRAQDEALRRATDQFSSAFSHAPIGMCLVGTDGRFLRVNRSLCELVGYTEDDLLGLTFQDITHADDLDADLALVQGVLTGAPMSHTMEKRYIHADGREIWALLAVSLVHDEDGAPLHFISQIQDITERRELEARLREQAERDPLTGLFNRRRFDEEMRRQIIRTGRTGEPAMLAVIDLDHFKRVNDAEGHLAGDDLLRAVSEALSGRLRRSDILVRMGGDEFAAILVGADEEGGAATARMLVSALRDVVGGGRAVTASVGLARIEADDDPAAVLARADAAMYAAKAAGRGVVRVGAEPA